MKSSLDLVSRTARSTLRCALPPSFVAGLTLAGLTFTGSEIAAQSPGVNNYWQRQSGCKFYEELKPFRQPRSHVVDERRTQLRDLLHDLGKMMDIAARAKPADLRVDKAGREICDDSDWAEAYERVKTNSLKMEGWLGEVFMKDQSERLRRVSAYGMFYFNDPQNVFNLISFLPGEPKREIRETGFQRALNFLRAHLPESVPQNPDPRFANNGVVVPRFKFNPLPFMQLLDVDRNIEKAQALWFLTEVLRIRADLGRAYLDEIRDILPALLTAEKGMVRSKATDFLAAIDPKRGRATTDASSNEDRLAWLKQLEHELFPPIRYISEGRIDLYASKDLDAIVTVGKRLLGDPDFLPHAAERVGQSTRYGVRLNHVPKPLDKLGIPVGVLIVGLNAAPTRNRAELMRNLKGILSEGAKEKEKYAKSLEDNHAKPHLEGAKPRPPRITSFLVEYIYKGKAKMQEFRLR